jgi:hypothetical protein
MHFLARKNMFTICRRLLCMVCRNPARRVFSLNFLSMISPYYSLILYFFFPTTSLKHTYYLIRFGDKNYEKMGFKVVTKQATRHTAPWKRRSWPAGWSTTTEPKKEIVTELGRSRGDTRFLTYWVDESIRVNKGMHVSRDFASMHACLLWAELPRDGLIGAKGMWAS